MDHVPEQSQWSNRLLAALPRDVLALLDRELRRMPLIQGQVLFEPGMPIESIYFPQSGLISLTVVTKDGSSIETANVGREGGVGLQAALGRRNALTRATTQIPGFCAMIATSRFAQIADAAVRDLILRYTEVLWAEAQQLAACNAVHDAQARLSRWLLQSADRTGSDSFSLTQEFLGQMLAVRRTTITVLAQALQERGAIKYSRGHIVIASRKTLTGMTCECYHRMNHDHLPRALGIDI